MKSSMATHWPHFRLRTFELLGLMFAYWREAEVEGARSDPLCRTRSSNLPVRSTRAAVYIFALYRICV
jgi:hypothetical protein